VPVLKNVLGLDLGSHSLKAVELRQTLRGVEVAQMRMLPRTDPDTPLPELVRAFVETHAFSTAHVVSALPGDRVVSRRLEFPFREQRRLAQAVPFELESSVPYELDDYVIDWDLANDERGRAEVLAAIAPRAEVSAAIETLRGAGFEPRTLESEGPVLANLCGTFDLSGTRLLVDLGHRKSTFCLIVGGRAAAARALPLGGAALTEAIARDRGLAPADAERAKCEQGVFGGRLSSSSASFRLLDRLARELVRTLGSIEPIVSRGQPVSEITMLGGSAQLERLDEFLSERCGVPVRRLGLPADPASGLAAGGSPLLFAPAIALALRGTPRARTRLDFRQDEFAVRLDLSGLRRQFGPTGILAAVAMGLATLSFATGVFVDSRRASELERQVAQLYGEALPGQTPSGSPVAGLREAVQSAHDRAEFLGVYRGNLSALDLLAEVSRHIPADLKISVEEISIDRQTIRIRCNTESFGAADRIRAELARFATFAQANIGSIERDPRTGATRFNVTISLSASERA
jgi:general secretion pathway protein L